MDVCLFIYFLWDDHIELVILGDEERDYLIGNQKL